MEIGVTCVTSVTQIEVESNDMILVVSQGVTSVTTQRMVKGITILTCRLSSRSLTMLCVKCETSPKEVTRRDFPEAGEAFS